MTYSIVARHPGTGQLGVAAQSHYFGVGALVGWARPGVGAVATQATVLVSYGPLGLDQLEAGKPVGDVLDSLLEADEHRTIRQVAMLSADGAVAVHTGTECIEHASHVTGDGYSVQGNMLRAAGIPEAMANAWESAVDAGAGITDGLLAALDAAEAAGGDARGRQSAAMVVAGPTPTEPWRPLDVNLRVEDHPAPLAELRRLVGIHAVYTDESDRAEALVDSGAPGEAVALAASWEERLGGNPEPGWWLGRHLIANGHPDLGRPLVQRAEDLDPGWVGLGAWLDAHPRDRD